MLSFIGYRWLLAIAMAIWLFALILFTYVFSNAIYSAEQLMVSTQEQLNKLQSDCVSKGLIKHDP